MSTKDPQPPKLTVVKAITPTLENTLSDILTPIVTTLEQVRSVVSTARAGLRDLDVDFSIDIERTLTRHVDDPLTNLINELEATLGVSHVARDTEVAHD